MSHLYNRMCGCSQCSAYEDAEARDQELADMLKSDLRKLPTLLAEVVLNDEEQRAATAAMYNDDAIEFARVWKAARDRFIDELVNQRADESGIDQAEAVRRLCRVYA